MYCLRASKVLSLLIANVKTNVKRNGFAIIILLPASEVFSLHDANSETNAKQNCDAYQNLP